MNFDVIIKDKFSNVSLDNSLTPINNKSVLSLINDFEEGSWRFDKFQKYIWNNIKETALTEKERSALLDDGEYTVLVESAKKLRLIETTNARGSEIGEIILYGIMKDYYNALPIVPKIFYKQNNKDEAKGSDSVHIVIESDDKFSLWFGESKFYNNIEDTRLDKIIDSVKDSISLKKIKKENSIITNVGDINDFNGISEEMKKIIIRTLSHDQSIDTIKPILNIPILLLYECDITKSTNTLTDEYKTEVIEFHKERATSYFKKQINKCKDVHLYEKINFHLILFPVADKEQIVSSFIEKAKVFRNS